MTDAEFYEGVRAAVQRILDWEHQGLPVETAVNCEVEAIMWLADRRHSEPA